MTIKINELSKKKDNSLPIFLTTNNNNSNNRVMLVDCHEPVSIIDQLRQKGVNVTIERLASGDYVFSNIGIERKTLADFWGSLTAKDKRIWRQMFELKRNFERPFLVIEKFNFAYLRSPVYSKQIWGTIASISLRGINVITIVSRTAGSKDFVDFLTYLYFAADPNKKTFKPVPVKSKNPKEVYSDCLCMIPGLGPVTVKKLVARYHTFDELLEASKEDLSQLCGKTRVRMLWRILHGSEF